MNELVWIIDSGKSSSFGNKGISGTYIIPKEAVRFEPKVLAGKKLWVVLRGREDRLFELIKIRKVERIIDGYHAGDYLISSEITQSFKLVSNYGEAAKFRIADTGLLPLGISELQEDVSAAIHQTVRQFIHFNVSPPDTRLLSKINFELIPNASRRLAKNSLRAVISRLTLEQVWANGFGKKLGPFANFAYALLPDDLKSSAVVDELKISDPIMALFEATVNKPPVEETPRQSPSVDTEFTEIEPDKVYAREFIFADTNLVNLEEALNKTEHAEKVHQDMLKDISAYLISIGITPYESGSVDLMFNCADALNVFEIKSSDQHNILAQSAKGAFQLACYVNELIKEYKGLNARLILHKTENSHVEAYALAALSRLGIEAIFYDPSLAWPNRVSGLLNDCK